MIKKGGQVKAKHGILGIHKRDRNEGITDDTKAKVLSVYNGVEYSRMMPGSADKVSIGKKVYAQKRLMMCTPKELF